MADYYDVSDWEAPEIDDDRGEWSGEWSGENAYGPEPYRCFPFPVLGGVGIGLGVAGLFCFPRNVGCSPRRFCFPRQAGCFPAGFCFPRQAGCFPAGVCFPRQAGCFPGGFCFPRQGGCYPRFYGCYPR